MSIQSISQSGWSSAFQRVSEAMMSYIPFAAVFFLLLFFGVADLYHWSDKEAVALDPQIQHKSCFPECSILFYQDDHILFIVDCIYPQIKKDFAKGRYGQSG